MWVIVDFSQVQQNISERLVLFLHLLMMASALLCFSCTNKFWHAGKYSVHSPHRSVEEVTVVGLQKPMVSFVLCKRPMARKLVWIFLLLRWKQFWLFRFEFWSFRWTEILRIGFTGKFRYEFRFGCFHKILVGELLVFFVIIESFCGLRLTLVFL